MLFIKSLIRSIIASPKNQYYDSSTNLKLDLSYITPQLIVTSAPVTNYIESWYRYPLNDLLQFLNSNYGSNWHIFNFRGESPGYDDSLVYRKVSHYPFPDHYPPTMNIIINCIDEIDNLLQVFGDKTNVVAVLHCKAGKGRSGTLCCAYLIYQKYQKYHQSHQSHSNKTFTLEDILLIYTTKRMNYLIGGEGISIISQKRYLQYWYDYIHNKQLRESYINWLNIMKFINLKIIRIGGLKLSNIDYLNISILTYITKIETDTNGNSNNRSNTIVKELIQLTNENCDIDNHDDGHDDYWITYNIHDLKIFQLEDIMIGIQSWSYIWFNIFFESFKSNGHGHGHSHGHHNNNKVLFNWDDDIDGFKGFKQKGIKLFNEIELQWDVIITNTNTTKSID